MVVPLDVIKTRMQTDETARGFRHAAKTILREQKGPFRARVFLNGASATALGYYLQGGAKFGGYELLKYNIFDRIERVGGGEAVRRWRLPVMMGAAGVAEVFASVMLAPLEVVKLRLQTDPSAAARGMVHTLVHISRDEGLGALFHGLKPITMRQLPYTVTKLVAYELCSTTLIAASRRFVSARGDAEDAPLALLLRPAMVLLSGILAGAAAAVVSQPADVLLTRICASTSIAKCSLDAAGSFRDQVAQLARGGLREAYAGLGPRLAMVSAMTSVQFLLYDWVRCQLQCDGSYANKG
jgi:solute carrier family 25 phosphate transporter 3